MGSMSLLLNGFLEKKEVIENIQLNNLKVVNYYIKSFKEDNNIEQIVQSFIRSRLDYFFYNENEVEIDELFLKNCISFMNDWFDDCIYWLIDNGNDIINSYKYFQEFCKIEQWDGDITFTLSRAQFNWYYKLFNEIKIEFEKYLNDKIKELDLYN